MSGYEDIIHLKYEKSKKHPHMSIYNRAAQFSPFVALTGYEDQIEEQGRITNVRAFLDEDKKQELDFKFNEIMQKPHQKIRVKYFVEDVIKAGGQYVQYEGKIKKFDFITQCLVMMDGTIIELENISELEII